MGHRCKRKYRESGQYKWPRYHVYVITIVTCNCIGTLFVGKCVQYSFNFIDQVKTGFKICFKDCTNCYKDHGLVAWNLLRVNIGFSNLCSFSSLTDAGRRSILQGSGRKAQIRNAVNPYTDVQDTRVKNQEVSISSPLQISSANFQE